MEKAGAVLLRRYVKLEESFELFFPEVANFAAGERRLAT
jgi:hypothetical protein